MAKQPVYPAGAPLFDTYGLTTPDQLAAQQQQESDQRFLQTAIAGRPMLGLGMDISSRLNDRIGQAFPSTGLGQDPQQAQAQQSLQLLQQIKEQSGGDPIKALQLGAQAGIPGAMDKLQAMMKAQSDMAAKDAEAADHNSAAQNRSLDNARADAAATQQTKKDTWQVSQKGDRAIVLTNGLGDMKAIDLHNGNAVADLADTNPAAYGSLIDSVGNYEINIPSFGRGTEGANRKLAFLAEVKAKYPDFTETGYKTMAALSYGPLGQPLQSQNAASRHLMQWKEASDRMGAAGGDVAALSKFASTINKNFTGGGPAAAMDAVAEVVGPEVVKAIVPGGGALDDRRAMKEKLFGSGLPLATRIQNLDVALTLMRQQREAAFQRAQSGAGGITREAFDKRFPAASVLMGDPGDATATPTGPTPAQKKALAKYRIPY
jgi:hypothetical protein